MGSMSENTKSLYADFNGSAPLNKKVKEFLLERMATGTFSNPNSSHALGKKIMFAIEKSRRSLAKNINAKANQIIFNSGASEGITQVFHSVLADKPQDGRDIIVTTGIEHSCVVKCCAYYEKRGYRIIQVSSMQSGLIDIEELKNIVDKNHEQIAFVTIMAANNETGGIQPLKEITSICHQHSLKVFSDTTQFIGKTKFDFQDSNLDFAVMSSHKIGAIIGSGALIAKDINDLKPLIMGGGQEKGLRGGTQNYIGIESMAVALQDFQDSLHLLDQVAVEREQFEQRMQKKFPQIKIIGQEAPRLASTTMLSHPEFDGQLVQQKLEDKKIYVTTSSACSDDEKEISKVLKSMGTDEQTARGVVRISFCCHVTKECYQHIENALCDIFQKN